jgi:hypothetical protein
MDRPFAVKDVHGWRVNFGHHEGELLDIREKISSLLSGSRFFVAVLNKEGSGSEDLVIASLRMLFGLEELRIVTSSGTGVVPIEGLVR